MSRQWMNGVSKIRRAVLWIGFAVLAIAVLGGESIAARLGWKYPAWLNSLNGVIASVIGILFIISALNVVRKGRRK